MVAASHPGSFQLSCFVGFLLQSDSAGDAVHVVGRGSVVISTGIWRRESEFFACVSGARREIATARVIL
jgi:hypothetical protein